MVRSLVQLTALLVLGIVVGNAFADEPEKILGGTDAHEGEFPYQVSLRLYNYHMCGGSIISPRHILTAAHCVEDIGSPPYTEFTVVSGSISISKGGQSHRVQHVQMHSGYIGTPEQSWKNDIAIITLAASMTFNRFQQPIALPTVDPPGIQKLIFSGWGVFNAHGEDPDNLQKVNVYSIPNTACQSQYIAQPIHPTHICAIIRSGVGACTGDSGGPLVYNNQQVGIASWVVPCAQGFADVYTRVSSFLPFINSVTGLY